MNNLFQAETVREVDERISKLSAASQRLWGKMDVGQMLAHCSAAMEMACGKYAGKRVLIGRLIGQRFVHLMTDDKPFSKNGPTSKELKVVDEREFTKEKERLQGLIHEFHAGGEAKCTRNPHPFFGAMDTNQWATGMYKHIDHHLKQFGV